MAIYQGNMDLENRKKKTRISGAGLSAVVLQAMWRSTASSAISGRLSITRVYNHFNQERHLVTAKSTNRDARRRWPSDAPSRPSIRLALGKLCHTQTACR